MTFHGGAAAAVKMLSRLCSFHYVNSRGRQRADTVVVAVQTSCSRTRGRLSSIRHSRRSLWFMNGNFNLAL